MPHNALLSASTSTAMSSSTLDKDPFFRRRSVDVGGLALAFSDSSLGEDGMGKGWGGWDLNGDSGALYAEQLSDLYYQTQSAINTPLLSPPPSITAETRRHLIMTLDSWYFEPHKLSEDEVLAASLILFESLFRIRGLQEEIGTTLGQTSNLLRHLRQVYRSANSYHNFQHALDVLQATYTFLKVAGLVPHVTDLLQEDASKTTWDPPKKSEDALVRYLTNEDIFCLYVASIGHDAGHPGFNNMFMKNARSPLSQVYDDKSPLEHMHCIFLLPIMRRHGLAHLVSDGRVGNSTGRILRETVLATDMGVHQQFMDRFSRMLKDPGAFTEREVRLLICQALIKCSDISNPGRPADVSQHWSAALEAEWTNQAMLEEQLQLPRSVKPATDSLAEARGQIFFISMFAFPLFDLTSKAIPEMKYFAEQSDKNRKTWELRLAEISASAHNTNSFPTHSQPSASTSSSTSGYPRSSQSPQLEDYRSVFPPCLPQDFFAPLARDLMALYRMEGEGEGDTEEETSASGCSAGASVSAGTSISVSVGTSGSANGEYACEAGRGDESGSTVDPMNPMPSSPVSPSSHRGFSSLKGGISYVAGSEIGVGRGQPELLSLGLRSNTRDRSMSPSLGLPNGLPASPSVSSEDMESSASVMSAMTPDSPVVTSLRPHPTGDTYGKGMAIGISLGDSVPPSGFLHHHLHHHHPHQHHHPQHHHQRNVPQLASPPFHPHPTTYQYHHSSSSASSSVSGSGSGSGSRAFDMTSTTTVSSVASSSRDEGCGYAKEPSPSDSSGTAEANSHVDSEETASTGADVNSAIRNMASTTTTTTNSSPNPSSSGPNSRTNPTWLALTPTPLPEPPTSSIRSVYSRAVRNKKSFHRSSWTPSLDSTTSDGLSVSGGLAGGVFLPPSPRVDARAYDVGRP